MAIVADLIQPVVIEVGDQSFVPPLPVGAMVTVGWDGTRDGVVGLPIASRFPTPSSAIAFLTEEPDEELEQIGISRPVLSGALSPESPYLESTVGQIWPR